MKYNVLSWWQKGKIMKKRLYRSRSERKIAGVCGGIAQYFDIDPKTIRLFAVIFCLVYGSGLVAYMLLVIFIPKEPKK